MSHIANTPGIQIPFRRWLVMLGFGLSLLLLTGCQMGLIDQPKLKPLAASEFYSDGRSARLPVDGTVAQDDIINNDVFTTGKGPDGNPVATFPISVTLEVVQRGQQRFNIYCSPCHGFDAYGNGMIVQRGFAHPPSFHDERLRQAPIGHFVDVMTNGFGQMYSYAYRIPPSDRWAIAAYIRALQYSQGLHLQDVPPENQSKVTGP